MKKRTRPLETGMKLARRIRAAERAAQAKAEWRERMAAEAYARCVEVEQARIDAGHDPR